TDSVGNGIGDACRCLQVNCAAPDQCHMSGSCQPTTGKCTNPLAPEGNACAMPNATAVCRMGVCSLVSCHSDFGDCNGNLDDGCETPTNTITNCGACGVACGADAGCAPMCGAGHCAVACPPPPTCDDWRDYDLGAECALGGRGSATGCSIG